MFAKFKQTTDSELLKEVKKSSQAAFRELFVRYEKKVFAFSMKLLRDTASAEEIVQEVFVKLWEYKDRIDHELPIGALLFKITRNHVLNYLRKQSRETASRSQYAESLMHIENQTENEILTNEYLKIFDQAVADLPEGFRKVYLMSRNEGKTYQQIAETLNISKDTVRIQLIKSLKLIRKKLLNHMASSSNILL